MQAAQDDAVLSRLAQQLLSWLKQQPNPVTFAAIVQALHPASGRTVAQALVECEMRGRILEKHKRYQIPAILECDPQRILESGCTPDPATLECAPTPGIKAAGHAVPHTPDPLWEGGPLHGVTRGLDSRQFTSNDLRARQVQRILGSDAATRFNSVPKDPSRTPRRAVSELYIPFGNIYAKNQITETQFNHEDLLNNNIIKSPRAHARDLSNGRARKPSRLNAVAKAQDTIAARMRPEQEHVKRMLSAKHSGAVGRESAADREKTVEREKAYGIALAYEAALSSYLGKPFLNYLKGRVDPAEVNYRHWVNASHIADAVECSYGEFVKAQFWAFDRWFARAPLPHQLGAVCSKIPAAERVLLYREATRKGEMRSETRVVGRVRPLPEVSQSVRFAHSERQLQSLMQNYGVTEEQILRVFARGAQASVYFDHEWLQTNATYRRLRDAGAL